MIDLSESFAERVLWYMCVGVVVVTLPLVLPLIVPLYLLGRLADWCVDLCMGMVRS